MKPDSEVKPSPAIVSLVKSARVWFCKLINSETTQEWFHETPQVKPIPGLVFQTSTKVELLPQLVLK